MKSFLFRWLPWLLCAAAILAVSSIPNLFGNLPEALSRKVIFDTSIYKIIEDLSHFGEYLVLSMLTAWAFIGQKNKGTLKTIVVLSLPMLFAFYDENFQINIPGRGFQVSDLIFDALGIIAGYLLYFPARKWFVPKKK
jgi:VanZ family protein